MGCFAAFILGACCFVVDWLVSVVGSVDCLLICCWFAAIGCGCVLFQWFGIWIGGLLCLYLVNVQLPNCFARCFDLLDFADWHWFRWCCVLSLFC